MELLIVIGYLIVSNIIGTKKVDHYEEMKRVRWEVLEEHKMEIEEQRIMKEIQKCLQ